MNYRAHPDEDVDELVRSELASEEDRNVSIGALIGKREGGF
ncbi:hypothetical protein [Paenibacillus sp. GM2FR]|nr:hypothetical protein [Paenibacillus sp. GM2FR]